MFSVFMYMYMRGMQSFFYLDALLHSIKISINTFVHVHSIGFVL